MVVNENDKIANSLKLANATDFKASYEAALLLENSAESQSVSTSASKIAEVKDGSDEIVMTNLKPFELACCRECYGDWNYCR